MGSIYKITNNINGKVYIGQTRVGVERRWKQHQNSSIREAAKDYNSYLHTSMRKYGKENFSIQEIESCLNEELNDREIFWIDYYNSFNKEYGYNLTLGGEGSQKYTDEEILQFWNSGKSVGEISEESGIDRGWISLRLKRCGISSEEISRRGYNSIRLKRGRPVYQYYLDGKYSTSFASINEARDITGIGHIEKCCDGKQSQAGGFKWSYMKYDHLPIINKKSPRFHPKEIVQISSDTNKIIGEYIHAAEASVLTGVDKSGITKACKGLQHTAGGFKWMYKDDYLIRYAS